VSLPPFALGTYHVHGIADGAAGSTVFDTTTRLFPAALFGIAALVLVNLLIAVRALVRRVRRRYVSTHPPKLRDHKPLEPRDHKQPDIRVLGRPKTRSRKPHEARHRKPARSATVVSLDELFADVQDRPITEWSNA
jgi:hypothetical protein